MNEYGSSQSPQSGPRPEQQASGARQLRRTQEGRMIAGVCSGAGAYLGIDPNILRLLLGVLTIFGGTGIAVYVIAWLIMPEDDKQASIAEEVINKANRK